MEGEKKMQSGSFLSSSPCCFSSNREATTNKHDDYNDPEKMPTQKAPGGWRSMPYILGNETFERLATVGLLANFMVFLQTQFHMDQVRANNILNIWSGTTNCAPLVGAFISDAYAGRFRTIAVASFASFLGMVTLTLVAWIPKLHPPPCASFTSNPLACVGPTTAQLGFLLAGLSLLSIGTGGIRPCSLPFGVDQFDPTTEEGRRGINSFYNWYYTTFTVVLIIALTLVVYIQDSISWTLGFGLPTALMLCSICLFFLGTKLYVHVEPTGSVFSGIARVLVAAVRKRHLSLDDYSHAVGGLYDPPPSDKAAADSPKMTKLPITQDYRWLNKAAIIEAPAQELKPDGTPSNPWRLCSVQLVEELKCIVRIVPIWASGIVCFTAMAQQGTFTISQALKMNRHLGPHFQIPPGSLSVISMLTIGLWVPFYDRVTVPALRRITRIESGITLLQRMGIGIVFSVFSMVVAALAETKRRSAAHPSGPPLSVLWLAPQLVLMGFAEAFNIIGQIEFYNRQFPEHMTSIGNALFFCTVAGANYLSSFLVTLVHGVTGRHGQPDWLTADINAGKVDYFYYLVAGIGVLNFVYFLIVASRYRYKSGSVRIIDQSDRELDVELSLSSKNVGSSKH